MQGLEPAGHLYLDCAATTPVIPEVLAAMRPLLERPGRSGGRGAVAEALGLEPAQVWLCSGGTEANNVAVTALQARAAGRGRPGVASQRTEHPSVLRALEGLQARGVEVQWLPLDEAGRVLEHASFGPGVGVLSVMFANNETGVVQPVEGLVARARQRGLLIHIDAVQAAPWLDIKPASLGADLVTVSAHKLGGPKGVGALLGPGVSWLPPPPAVSGALAAGLAVALAERRRRRGQAAAVRAARDALEHHLLAALPQARVNGAGALRLPGHLSVSFAGVSGEAVVTDLDQAGIAASAGSACSSGDPGPSHVLLALGRTPAEASASVRLSLGEPLGPEEVAGVVERIVQSVERLRRLC